MARRRPNVNKRPPAVADLIEIADFLALTSGLAAADRFLDLVEETLATIAAMPGIGTLWGSERPALDAVRFFPVTRFRNHLIFYRQVEGGIEVVRVLHGARELPAILEAEG